MKVNADSDCANVERRGEGRVKGPREMEQANTGHEFHKYKVNKITLRSSNNHADTLLSLCVLSRNEIYISPRHASVSLRSQTSSLVLGEKKKNYFHGGGKFPSRLLFPFYEDEIIYNTCRFVRVIFTLTDNIVAVFYSF